MFGIGKKKSEKEEEIDAKPPQKTDTKSKQKNDLFTLLEETPTKNQNPPTESPPITPPKKEPNASLVPKFSKIIPKNETEKEAKKEPENEAKKEPEKEAKKEPEKEAKKEPEKEAKKEPENEHSKKSFSENSSRPESMFNKTGNNIVSQEIIFKHKESKPKESSFRDSSINGDKSQLLVLEVEKLPEKTIKPFVDFNESTLFYPILSKIGESPDNISLLNELVDEGVLVKEVFEKLIVCPLHPDTYSSSVRLYCPKCNSLNVDKLNLYEHKRCGYIAESTECDFSNPNDATCPSCKRKILDFKKEIRIPAMWHQCIDCSEKFDNAIIKLYCRKYEHDFETGTGQFFTTYSYKLKDYEAPITSNDEKMHEDLVVLLNGFNFDTQFKASVKGKSGNTHKIPVYAKNQGNGETICIFINRQTDDLTQTEINSILIPILDVSPNHVLLLTNASLDEFVKPVAKQYGIEIISDPGFSRIIQHVESFVSERYSKNGEA